MGAPLESCVFIIIIITIIIISTMQVSHLGQSRRWRKLADCMGCQLVQLFCHSSLLRAERPTSS